MFRYLTSLFVASGLSLLAATAVAETRLMMAEEPGCIWCARWDSEIGPIYMFTGEGAAAPLWRVDITDPLPEKISLVRSVNFTPTFVLLINGQEVERLEGYPGEDFFWGLLGNMLTDQDIPFEMKTAADDGEN